MRTTSDTKPAGASAPVRYDFSLLGDHDLHLFNEGTHYRLYDKLGAHVLTVDGVRGTHFAVWAPNAREVSVMGDFNSWDRRSHPLHPRGHAGIWESFIPGVAEGTCYKYAIVSQQNDFRAEKADPLAFRSETPPKSGSVVSHLDYLWGDQAWMEQRNPGSRKMLRRQRLPAGAAAPDCASLHPGYVCAFCFNRTLVAIGPVSPTSSL